MEYGRIFVSVRQRIAAFKYWREYLKTLGLESYPYGGVEEDSYLDEAYRFLFTSASHDFMAFCAHKEERDFGEYCASLGVDVSKLLRALSPDDSTKGDNDGD